jgi:CBS domain-containing protein
MRASDVMTTGVVTASPESKVRDVVGLLLEHRVSAVPVVDADGKIVGIVSEGDLTHRHESGTEHTGHWWRAITETSEEAARAYTRTHGRLARDVMTAGVVTVAPDTPLNEAAALLDKHRIKRLPVVKDGRLVGIVSRANLLQALFKATAGAATDRQTQSDQTIRDAVVEEIRANDLGGAEVNVVVVDGVVSLWGAVDSDAQRRAMTVAAQSAAGVQGVEDHLATLPSRRLMGL